MTSRVRGVIGALSLLLFLAVASAASAQVSTSTRYLKGQSVQPIYEGWERNPDGTYNLWFGYLNRNWEQRLDIPIGPDNNIEPGGAGLGVGVPSAAAALGLGVGWDSGQPTVFQTGQKRRQYFAFKVVVPADWPKDRDVIWTLTANGTRLQAFGSLWPVWMVNADVVSANRGAMRDTRADGIKNRPPAIAEAPKQETVATGIPLTLTMAVTDDDLPRRRPPGQLWGAAGEGARGDGGQKEPPLRDSLRVSWVQWRGPGTATFKPDVARVRDPEGKQTGTTGKATTAVTFDTPGTYVLRAYAEDMSLFTVSDLVTVTVTEASSAQLRP